MSGPLFDWIADVMRACTPSPLIVSISRLIPSAFWQSSLILPLSSWSETGTKSTNFSQCSVVPWAKTGARPLARIPARPPVVAVIAPAPESFNKWRRLIRGMAIPSPALVLVRSRHFAGSAIGLSAPFYVGRCVGETQAP
jgi:hypothetical protein